MDKFQNAKELIRQYAFMKAKRKKMEEQKKILLVHIMKEISAVNKLSIPDQEKMAKATPEYKQLLIEIKNMVTVETDYLWKLNQFFVENESYVSSSALNRKNNWNIHNI